MEALSAQPAFNAEPTGNQFFAAVLQEIEKTVKILYKSKYSRDGLFSNDFEVSREIPFLCGCTPDRGQSSRWRVSSDGELRHLGCKNPHWKVPVGMQIQLLELLARLELPRQKWPKQPQPAGTYYRPRSYYLSR